MSVLIYHIGSNHTPFLFSCNLYVRKAWSFWKGRQRKDIFLTCFAFCWSESSCCLCPIWLGCCPPVRQEQFSARNYSKAKKDLWSNKVSAPDASLHTPESKPKQSHLHLPCITLTSQPAPAPIDLISAVRQQSWAIKLLQGWVKSTVISLRAIWETVACFFFGYPQLKNHFLFGIQDLLPSCSFLKGCGSSGVV